MATKWPSFDNNKIYYQMTQFRVIIKNGQDFVFPESTTVNGEDICQRRARRAQRNGSYQGHNFRLCVTI